ncbi:type II toxin-antitoxin system PemK/MazF family toxin [Microbacterium sp. cf332]|uniref:type II toxin-antitoxin system PemK/MazF family toxin n=1 Tax=Microbacterium sp. cf332 TaxID=1761804 RepID=UPI00088C91D2|nr:type II toxin-antitoxin system PemK/MazF family toxin [Microbacterium sp. cf332]SDQ15475.1 PemK-like, MazF-like toxin of type II toxin-antitoxin system [Microbacterium sp. cf332]
MSVLSRVWDLLRRRTARSGEMRSRLGASGGVASPRSRGGEPVRAGETLSSAGSESAVVEMALPDARGLRLAYEPRPDAEPDPGEIVWAWVPYEEDATRGKDRPMLVLARAGRGSSWAMKLTSKPHDGERDHLPLGTGDWDRERRPSWLDVDQIYLVPVAGIRRTAGSLDRSTYARVAQSLSERYGWRVAG